MSKEIKKFHENVLTLEVCNDLYTIHRRNIAGVVFRLMVDKSYTIWVHLIKPLQYDQNHDGTKSPFVWVLTISNVTFEHYLEYVNWFDNPYLVTILNDEKEEGKLL